MKTEATHEQKPQGKKGRKSKVVNLTVHKNTLDKKLTKDRKETFQDFFKAVQDMIPAPLDFAIIAFDADNFTTAFICENKSDLLIFPEKIKQALLREVNNYLDSCEPIEIDITED